MADVRLYEDFAGAEGPWREIEAHGTPNPYARYDWCDAYRAEVAVPRGDRVVAALLSGPGGTPAALLPLGVTRRLGVVTARVLGDGHANLKLPVLGADVPGDAGWWQETLARLARTLGADLFELSAQPDAFAGRRNPLALPGAARSVEDVPAVALGAGARERVEARLSGPTRKKLRAKARHLEGLGPVRAYRAAGEAETAAVLGAFFVQKAARMAAMDLPDPFADPRVRAFLHRAATPAGGHPPAISLYALDAAGRIAATFGFAAGPGHLSGMFTSFDPDPALAKGSPGDALLRHVLDDAIGRGLDGLDLGAGGARYKGDICDGVIPLVDVVVPCTAMGRVAGLSLGLAREAKRRVKADPRLMSAARSVQRGLAGGSRQAATPGRETPRTSEDA